MNELLLISVKTAGIVVAACVVVDFVILRLVRYGKIKFMRRQRS